MTKNWLQEYINIGIYTTQLINSVLDLWENQTGSAMYFLLIFTIFPGGESIQTGGLRGTRGGRGLKPPTNRGLIH